MLKFDSLNIDHGAKHLHFCLGVIKCMQNLVTKSFVLICFSGTACLCLDVVSPFGGGWAVGGERWPVGQKDWETITETIK